MRDRFFTFSPNYGKSWCSLTYMDEIRIMMLELAKLVFGMTPPSNARSHVRSIAITAISTKKEKKLTRLYIKFQTYSKRNIDFWSIVQIFRHFIYCVLHLFEKKLKCYCEMQRKWQWHPYNNRSIKIVQRRFHPYFDYTILFRRKLERMRWVRLRG